MTTTFLSRPTDTDAADADDEGTRRRAALLAAAGLALLAGVALRAYLPSALWLDEALTVNIARLPLSQLPDALRHDAAPPLYYALLHGWLRLFGTGDLAARSLSALLSALTLPVAYLVGRRLRGRATGWLAVLLLSSNPFAIYYAGEARMYSLCMLLVFVLALTLLRVLERPEPARLLALGAVAAGLLYTHYWSLFLLAALGLVLLGHVMWGPRRAVYARAAAALAGGGVLFLPWLPVLAFQVQHTGTPWAGTPRLAEVVTTVFAWCGGTTGWGLLLGLLLCGLAAVSLYARMARSGAAVVLRPPVDGVARDLALVCLGTLVLGIGTGIALHAGYVQRYSSVALPGAVLLAALGLTVLPAAARHRLVAGMVVLGLLSAVTSPATRRKTQAGAAARLISAHLRPGDLVVYCPDQLGPAVSRLLPAGTRQVVYPTLGAPDRVDWVDYARRNRAASPQRFFGQVEALRPRAVWLVYSATFRTYGDACPTLDHLFLDRVGSRSYLLQPNGSYVEHEGVLRYPALP